LILSAPAKLNLCLFVGPPRDDGLHEIRSLFEPISLADQLDVMIHPIAGTSGQKQLLRTDGSGWFGAVKLAPGTYRVQVVEPGAEGTAATIVRVKVGVITQVGLRVDTA